MTFIFLVLVDKEGITQLSRWWTPLTFEERKLYEGRIRREIGKDAIFARLEVPLTFADLKLPPSEGGARSRSSKAIPMVVRHYGNLRCALGYEEGSENPIAVCEFVNLYFESLRKLFRKANFDLQQNLPSALRLLEEFVQAGEICETSTASAVANAKSLAKLPKA